ncbi:MAG: HsdR family type I site-specific deoxyribonuclease, partial [Flavobacteriales bacterium]|nr:HsdR family type I site-specific deoxyribonuclease [Flavobacteriales bacterium]
LQMLMKLGYRYVDPGEAERLRGGRTSNVLLEEVLRQKLREINSIRLPGGHQTVFSDENIERAIRQLKTLPFQEGYMAAAQKAYELLTLGLALEQNVDGDRKSFTLRYIDWENPRRNEFHVTEEFSVLRTGRQEHYRPDIVLFVNGIPLAVMECKRPDIKNPLEQAISQHLRNQQEDGIRPLYALAQILLALSVTEAAYATTGTLEKFWARWKEKFPDSGAEQEALARLVALRNQPLPESDKKNLFAGRYRYVRDYFDALEKQLVVPTEQDRYLYDLLRPERLLDFTYNFILFENGVKKIARYQQYFAVKKTISRLRNLENGRRPGGVIWHTQGSGKSLTMVMLAQAIAQEPAIKNPKIVLVTDRTDLDDQITTTFKKCGLPVQNAHTGSRLTELLKSDSSAVITTIVNKFNTAVRTLKPPLESSEIFVLVDEGHRSHYGVFNINMQKTLPKACYIAFTGTPLFRKEKSTIARFGGLIDTYTVDQAVQDKAVVPLLYEGRHAFQNVQDKPLDNYFNLISEPLTPYQRADLKKKFSRAELLNQTEQKIYACCWDISQHFKNNWKGTPFKGQLVCPSKAVAIQYKKFLDEIGMVSSEVLISPPDLREGEDTPYAESQDIVRQFWRQKMQEHGSPEHYEKNVINRYKNEEDPEIIIVVDKLLTGFDEPRNVVLYLTRHLQGHRLLQAIARVNRVYPEKEFGYIVDYYGVIGKLGDALQIYSSFEEFDPEDLQGVLADVSAEIQKLPQKHAAVWEIFKDVPNKRDAEALQQKLRDAALRHRFYDVLSQFARSLRLALSTFSFHQNTDPQVIERYKNDLVAFLNLRRAVVQRYSDKIDFKHYESQIQKLLNSYVTTEKVEPITPLVNIFDQESFQKELERTVSIAARADTIASRTAVSITEKMEEDPALYKKFSEMLRQAIADYESDRINETQYLERVQEIMRQVNEGGGADLPEILRDKKVPRACYGILSEALKSKLNHPEQIRLLASESALHLDTVIRNCIMEKDVLIVDWPHKQLITGKLMIEIGDFIIDEIQKKHQVPLSFEEIDALAAQCVEIARIHYKG